MTNSPSLSRAENASLSFRSLQRELIPHSSTSSPLQRLQPLPLRTMFSTGFLFKSLAGLVLVACVSTTSVDAAPSSSNTTTASAKYEFPEHCPTLPGMDRPGFDLVAVRDVSDACPMHCGQTKGCAAFVYANGVCYLKSRVGPLVPKDDVAAFDCVDYSAESVCLPYTDIDFVGMDIGNKPAKAFGECCDICNAFSGCTAYAWTDFNGGTCWLKKSVGHVVAKAGVTSSSIIKLWGPVCPFEYDTDFEGNDIGNAPAGDAGVCCSQCKGNAACKAYSWSNYNGGTCWMKSGKGKTVGKAGVISAKLAGF